MFARPAWKPARGDSSLSRHTALVSGGLPLIARVIGGVLKEDVGRGATIRFQIIKIKALVPKSWVLLNKSRYDRMGDLYVESNPPEGSLVWLCNSLNAVLL